MSNAFADIAYRRYTKQITIQFSRLLGDIVRYALQFYFTYLLTYMTRA